MTPYRDLDFIGGTGSLSSRRAEPLSVIAIIAVLGPRPPAIRGAPKIPDLAAWRLTSPDGGLEYVRNEEIVSVVVVHS